MLALEGSAADLLFIDAHTHDGFGPDPVSDEQVAEIWDLVKWAPTSGNSSPGRLLLVRSAAARERLVAHMNKGNQAKTLAAPLTVVAAADIRFHELWPTVAPHRAEAAARLEEDPAARERLAILSATLQAAYFIIGIRAAGLAAGPMGGFDREGVDAEFFADGSWRSLVVINVGAPAAGGARERLPRLGFSDVSRVV
jgi:3-hydroxypropanoate dehydrogenase